jgi:predicted GIY-YIG superfamily endonuclease
VLYFVQEQGSDLVKVGYAKDPAARIAQLQTGSPRKLTILDIVEGDRQAEAILHRRLRTMHKGVRGEWFILDEETRALLSSYRTGSLRESIEREKAMRKLQAILDDMGKSIQRLRRVISKKR